MGKKTVDDYIQEGIHGSKEIKPEERKKYLGTIRERIVVVLPKGDLFKESIPEAFIELLKKNKSAQLYLNGDIGYSHLSKYVKLADSMDVKFKIVTNREYDTSVGLVLAYDHAINKENIELTEPKPTVPHKNDETKAFSFFKKLFKTSDEQ